MLNVIEKYKYSKEHEWLFIEEDIITIGITDYAQNALGDIVYIELPKPNQKFNAGDSFATIESVKAVSDIYTPVSCEVLEVNISITSSPDILNQAPYETGWIAKFKILEPMAEDTLMNSQEYTQYIQKL